MVTDRDPNHLCQDLRVIYTEWLDRCKAAGLNTKAITTWRSALAQDEAKAAGLSNASAGESPHNCTDANGNPASKALDFAIFEDHGVYITDGTDDRYRQAGQIAKDLGMVWGGDWEGFKDYDHIEMANWKTT